MDTAPGAVVLDTNVFVAAGFLFFVPRQSDVGHRRNDLATHDLDRPDVALATTQANAVWPPSEPSQRRRLSNSPTFEPSGVTSNAKGAVFSIAQ
jgi:hypothetical protein